MNTHQTLKTQVVLNRHSQSRFGFGLELVLRFGLVIRLKSSIALCKCAGFLCQLKIHDLMCCANQSARNMLIAVNQVQFAHKNLACFPSLQLTWSKKVFSNQSCKFWEDLVLPGTHTVILAVEGFCTAIKLFCIFCIQLMAGFVILCNWFIWRNMP